MHQHTQQALIPELTMTTQFLPACAHCGEPHPLSRRGGVADPSVCPSCGAPAPVPQGAREIPVAIVGFSPAAILARALFFIGRFLRRLAKGL